jgi:hypothetical protein
MDLQYVMRVNMESILNQIKPVKTLTDLKFFWMSPFGYPIAEGGERELFRLNRLTTSDLIPNSLL